MNHDGNGRSRKTAKHKAEQKSALKVSVQSPHFVVASHQFKLI